MINLAQRLIDMTVGQAIEMRGESMVNVVTEDGIGQDFPKDVLEEFFGAFVRTLKRSGLSVETAKDTILAPFFDTRFALRARKPMSQWAPYFDVVYDREWEGDEGEEKDPRRVFWFGRDELSRQIPWIRLTDNNVYWLRNLDRNRPEKPAKKRTAVISYIDSFRRYLIWLINNDQPPADMTELNVLPRGKDGRKERYEKVVTTLLETLSLQDWIQFKREKAFRLYAQQMMARRQYTDGKTEIFQKAFLPWAWLNNQVFSSNAPWSNDVVLFDKGAGNERTQAIRMMFRDLKKLQDLGLVWIGDVVGQEKWADDDTPRERSRKINNNQLKAEADWAGKVFTLRLMNAQSNINDPQSAEAINSECLFLNNDRSRFTNLLVGNISITWSIAKRLSYIASWNAGTSEWFWSPRPRPLPEEERSGLWDESRTWLWAEARDAIVRRLNGRNRHFNRGDIEKLVEAGYFDPWIEQRNEFGNVTLRILQDLRREGDYEDQKRIYYKSRGANARVNYATSDAILAEHGEEYDPHDLCKDGILFDGHWHNEAGRELVFVCEAKMPDQTPLQHMEMVMANRKVALILLGWLNKMYDYENWLNDYFSHRPRKAPKPGDLLEEKKDMIKAGTAKSFIIMTFKEWARGAGGLKEEAARLYSETKFAAVSDVLSAGVERWEQDVIEHAGEIVWLHMFIYTAKRILERYKDLVRDSQAMDQETAEEWKDSKDDAVDKLDYVIYRFILHYPWSEKGLTEVFQKITGQNLRTEGEWGKYFGALVNWREQKQVQAEEGS